jgi:hypothetical protein
MALFNIQLRLMLLENPDLAVNIHVLDTGAFSRTIVHSHVPAARPEFLNQVGIALWRALSNATTSVGPASRALSDLEGASERSD